MDKLMMNLEDAYAGLRANAKVIAELESRVATLNKQEQLLVDEVNNLTRNHKQQNLIAKDKKYYAEVFADLNKEINFWKQEYCDLLKVTKPKEVACSNMLDLVKGKLKV